MGRTIRFLIVLVVVGAVAVFAYVRFARPVRAAAPNVATATVQRGDLAATVSAAGNISSPSVVDLGFGQSGTVKAVNVVAGQQVKAGQVLATLDTTNLDLAVQNAQANLKAAQDKLALAKNPNTPQDIASARAALQAAQANYDKLAAPPLTTDVAAAQASVVSTQAAYDNALKTAGTSNTQLDTAAAAVEKAQATLQQAQAAYNQVAGAPNVGMLPQSVTLQQATVDYQSAVSSYQTLAATASTSSNSTVQTAKSALDSAVANLYKVQHPTTQNDLNASQAQVSQAQDALDKLLAGTDPNTLDVDQVAVDQANIALKQAQYQLQQGEILAPFDGVITAVNVEVGQGANGFSTNSSGSIQVGTGALQIADLSRLQVIIPMAEVDVTGVKVGQSAQVSLDALPNLNLTGTVTEVSPAGALTQGVVNYPVTIALTNPPASVKTGMSATVNVITAQHSNVLMVPNRAVRTQAGGASTGGANAGGASTGGANRQRYVSVLFEGQQIQVPVTTGLSNDTMTEITSGLKEGDTVVIPTTTTTTTGGGPGGGPGGRVFLGG